MNIETGRLVKSNKIPVNEHKRQFCNTLEDEYHCVLECQMYSDYKRKYIDNCYWNRPNINKLEDSFTNQNKIRVMKVYKKQVRQTKIL